MSRRYKCKASNRPPEGAAWIWHTLELIASPAWKGQSINCRRLIEFLEREHLSHGGNENGNLLAPYGQLAAAGIGRRLIHITIAEAETRGLVAVERGGKRGAVLSELNRFRLTYMWTKSRTNGVWNWAAPTDDWKHFKGWNPHGSKLSTRRISARRCTVTVHEGELPTVHEGELPPSQVIEIPMAGQCTKVNSFLYLGEGDTYSTHSAGPAHSEAGAKRQDELQTLGSVALKSLAQLDADLPDRLKAWVSPSSKQNLARAA